MRFLFFSFLTLITNLLSAQGGVVDSTFGRCGKATALEHLQKSNTYKPRTQIAVQPDGKILQVGTTDTAGAGPSVGYYTLARYNGNGTLDSTFGKGGCVKTNLGGNVSNGNSLVLQPDGKIIVGGQPGNSSWEFGLIRYFNNGDIDSSFGVNGKIIGPVPDVYSYGISSILLQPDGKIVATTSGYKGFYVYRFDASGKPDNNFGINGMVSIAVRGASNGPAFLALQTDGKILIAGTSGYLDFTIMRFTSGGTLDQSFGNGGLIFTDFNGEWDFAYGIAIQSDNKIVVGGRTRTVHREFALARYNIDGSLWNSLCTIP